MHDVLYSAGYSFDKEKYSQAVYNLIDQILEEYSLVKDTLQKKPRILLTGSPIGGDTRKVIESIESQGGVVVSFESCGGIKAIDEMTDENNPDLYEALARRYLGIGCSCMSPNVKRKELIGRVITEYQVDGVIDMVLHACHTYNVETYGIGKMVKEEYQIPYLALETDYSRGDVEQLNTRIGAFIEMLGCPLVKNC